MQILKNKQKLLIIASVFLVAIICFLNINDTMRLLKTDTDNKGIAQVQVLSQELNDKGVRSITKNFVTVINSQEPEINISSNINANIKYNQNNLKVGNWIIFEMQDVEGYYVDYVSANGNRVSVIGNKFEIILSQTNDIYVHYEKYDSEKEREWLFDLFLIIFVTLLVTIAPLLIILIIKKRKRG